MNKPVFSTEQVLIPLLIQKYKINVFYAIIFRRQRIHQDYLFDKVSNTQITMPSYVKDSQESMLDPKLDQDKAYDFYYFILLVITKVMKKLKPHEKIQQTKQT